MFYSRSPFNALIYIAVLRSASPEAAVTGKVCIGVIKVKWCYLFDRSDWNIRQNMYLSLPCFRAY